MKLSSLLSGATGLVALGSLVGCELVEPLPPAKGGVEFAYVLIVDDGLGGLVAAINCAEAGVTTVKFNIGDDDNGDGVLEAAEAVTQIEQECNQADANADGILDAAEFGAFDSGLNIDPDTYGAFSIEFLDAANNNVQWSNAVGTLPADVFTFIDAANGTTIVDQQNLLITFQGDGAQVDGELQAFFGI